MHIDCTAPGPLLNTLSTAAHQLGEACNAYAQHIEDLRSELERMAEIAAGVAVVGVVLTFCAAGISDAVAAGGEGVVVAEASAAALAMTVESATQQDQVQQWMGQMRTAGRTSPALAPNGKKPKIDARRAFNCA